MCKFQKDWREMGNKSDLSPRKVGKIKASIIETQLKRREIAKKREFPQTLVLSQTKLKTILNWVKKGSLDVDEYENHLVN